MKTKGKKQTRRWLLGAALAVPALLVVLFELLKGNQAAMDSWVFGVMGPAEQLLGRLWSAVPFSVAEVLIVLFIAGNVVWIVRALVLLVTERCWQDLLRRALKLVAAWLWLLAAFHWMWNVSYYATDFAHRSGLAEEACSVEELEQVTVFFARRAGELSKQIERDAEGHFAVPRSECLDCGLTVYENLATEFEFLGITGVRAKPLLFSRLQSVLGFTGIYFPFTGEANVNADSPACLLPATIAHEMAHQRMIAAEEEANFVGIAACVTCDDVVFQYSGYLMGLIHLSNALYSADKDAWYEVRADFPQELITDWNDNNAYWEALESKVEEAAENAYDSYLKNNDQTMGIRSYGACVDLLVAWTMDRL